MKAGFVALFALSGMIASSLANPIAIEPEVERRQYETQGGQLDDLLTALSTHADNISKISLRTRRPMTELTFL